MSLRVVHRIMADWSIRGIDGRSSVACSLASLSNAVNSFCASLLRDSPLLAYIDHSTVDDERGINVSTPLQYLNDDVTIDVAIVLSLPILSCGR